MFPARWISHLSRWISHLSFCISLWNFKEIAKIIHRNTKRTLREHKKNTRRVFKKHRLIFPKDNLKIKGVRYAHFVFRMGETPHTPLTLPSVASARLQNQRQAMFSKCRAGTDSKGYPEDKTHRTPHRNCSPISTFGTRAILVPPVTCHLGGRISIVFSGTNPRTIGDTRTFTDRVRKNGLSSVV